MEELCRRFQESWDDPQCPETIARHGAGCDVCREFVRRQEQLHRHIEGWQPPAFSEDFTLAVVSRLAEEKSKKRSIGELLGELLHLRLAIPLPVGALVTGILLVSIGLNWFLWMQNHPEKRPSNRLESVTQTETSPNISVIPARNEFNPFSQNWTGTGVFLLIPMVDLNVPSIPKLEPKPQSTVKAKSI